MKKKIYVRPTTRVAIISAQPLMAASNGPELGPPDEDLGAKGFSGWDDSESSTNGKSIWDE